MSTVTLRVGTPAVAASFCCECVNSGSAVRAMPQSEGPAASRLTGGSAQGAGGLAATSPYSFAFGILYVAFVPLKLTTPCCSSSTATAFVASSMIFFPNRVMM